MLCGWAFAVLIIVAFDSMAFEVLLIIWSAGWGPVGTVRAESPAGAVVLMFKVVAEFGFIDELVWVIGGEFMTGVYCETTNGV